MSFESRMKGLIYDDISLDPFRLLFVALILRGKTRLGKSGYPDMTQRCAECV